MDTMEEEKNIQPKRRLSVLDWVLLYTGTVVLLNGLIASQMYPSEWMASFLPGGRNQINLLFLHEILQCGLLVGGVLLFLHLRGQTMRSIGWKSPEKAINYLSGAIFGVATCSLVIMISGVLTQLFPQWATTQNVVETTLQAEGLWGITAAFLSVGIMAPLCEELLFRGYLFHAVTERFDEKISVVITSFFFAAVHGQWFQLFPLFLAGVFLNWFYLRSQSLIATVVMHSAWNIFSLFLVLYLNVIV